MFDEIFMTIRSVVLHEVDNTNKHTDKRWVKDNYLGGGTYVIIICDWTLVLIQLTKCIARRTASLHSHYTAYWSAGRIDICPNQWRA